MSSLSFYLDLIYNLAWIQEPKIDKIWLEHNLENADVINFRKRISWEQL